MHLSGPDTRADSRTSLPIRFTEKIREKFVELGKKVVGSFLQRCVMVLLRSIHRGQAAGVSGLCVGREEKYSPKAFC
jgi:hypothetical protein